MTSRQQLMTVDAVVNLVLGTILLLFPAGVVELLGLPPTETFFYTSILGGVIFGIGLALILELRGDERSPDGLGLTGAIAINLCGAGMLLYWLLFGGLNLPLGGSLLLWTVAVAVLGIAVAELSAIRRSRTR